MSVLHELTTAALPVTRSNRPIELANQFLARLVDSLTRYQSRNDRRDNQVHADPQSDAHAGVRTHDSLVSRQMRCSPRPR